MPKRVVVEIDPKTGEMTFEVEGVAGAKCTDITNVLSAGKKIVSEQYTNEYYDVEDRPDYINNGE